MNTEAAENSFPTLKISCIFIFSFCCGRGRGRGGDWGHLSKQKFVALAVCERYHDILIMNANNMTLSHIDKVHA